MLLGALSKMAGALLEPKAATGNSITRRSQGPLQLLSPVVGHSARMNNILKQAGLR